MSTTFKMVRDGYDPEQVDRFLADAKEAYENKPGCKDINSITVRQVGFKRARMGYDMSEVDSVLERLEAAFIQRKRANVVKGSSQDEWLRQVAQMASRLYPRMDRPRGERFASALPKTMGYNKEEVDRFIDDLGRYFDGDVDLTSQQVHRVVFGAAKGNDAYDMAVVDTYLDLAGEILLSVE